MENAQSLDSIFQVREQVVVITGGAGILGSAITRALAQEGARVAILERREEKALAMAEQVTAEGGQALGMCCDVLQKDSVQAAAERVLERFGTVDILINGAGGNRPQATTSPDLPFFDLPQEAIQTVFDLNMIGTLLPCQVFGKVMAAAGRGVILNVSSMAANRPLTRVPAYAGAKAAVNNLTQWLAVHMAQEYSPHIRVNAIAPGFFQTEQNRYLLTDRETGLLTPRGSAILGHTPMGRFGVPEDLVGTVLWLVSPASRFVTGIVVPIDGGFSAFSGV